MLPVRLATGYLREPEKSALNETEPSTPDDSQQNLKPPAERPEPVGPGLKPWLVVVLGLFAILSVNSLYLVTVTMAENWTGRLLQDSFYQWMFLGHLALGLVFIVPLVLFGLWHLKRSWSHPNRRAVKAGLALFTTSLLLLISGLLLMRLEGIVEVRSELWRSIFYVAHVATPLLAAWLFVLHRLAGPKIHWSTGVMWSVVALLFTGGMLLWHQNSGQEGASPSQGDKYFEPSLARTIDGKFISHDRLMREDTCLECHPTAHALWSQSAHRFSSFNNPAYLASVRNTREVLLARDGNVHAARFCAGCHDPVPFFSGAFDDPSYDDVNDPTSQAGITCTVCHAIEAIPGPRGNSEFLIGQPDLYPFAMSDSPLLTFINRQLIKAKPAFHKKTYLKPLHQSAEFCSTCHKVHIPEELNHYRFLRGQNHYDSWLLSGVSGHGVASFYYPPKAQTNCNGCHMPLVPSNDFAARDFDGSGVLSIHDHLFPGANTAMKSMVGTSQDSLEIHRKFLEGSLRVDIFGIRRGEDVDAPLEAPIGPKIPTLQPGETILLETVLRTMGMGHHFTQGTVDSNQVWVEVDVTLNGETIGTSGSQDEIGVVDPWSHFVNALVLSRDGNRIDQRNVEDIFVALYNHQIPPGAADSLHYRLQVPDDATGEITVKIRTLYRKFDTHFLHIFRPPPPGDPGVNDLPIVTLGEDTVTFPIGNGTGEVAEDQHPLWMRWNDYGIGLLRKGGMGAVRGELVSAISAFNEVTQLGRADGDINRARAHMRSGRIDEAAKALAMAAQHDPPPYPWTLDWFSALVNRENGHYEEALTSLTKLVETHYQQARERGFDFSRDVRLLNELGTVNFALARRLDGEQAHPGLQEANSWFEKTLVEDPENITAHWNLAQIQDLLGNSDRAAQHRLLHGTYKPDDSARDASISLHRSNNPPANHAASDIVIYDLHRNSAAEENPSGGR